MVAGDFIEICLSPTIMNNPGLAAFGQFLQAPLDFAGFGMNALTEKGLRDLAENPSPNYFKRWKLYNS